jgi:hypothetical protein
MNLSHVTDPARLEQIKTEEQGRKTFFGDDYAPYSNDGQLPLLTYKTPAYGTGWLKGAGVSELELEAAAAKMMAKPIGQKPPANMGTLVGGDENGESIPNMPGPRPGLGREGEADMAEAGAASRWLFFDGRQEISTLYFRDADGAA